MKRTSLIVFYISCLFSSCDRAESLNKRFATRNEHRCALKVSDYLYTNDTLSLIRELKEYVLEKKSPYNAPAYNEKNVIVIDTVLYNSERNNAAVLLVIKCSDEKSSEDWSYDGIVHFARRTDEGPQKGRWKIYNSHGALHVRAENYLKMTDILRQDNFVLRSYEADRDGRVGYNLDDCRFWNSDEFISNIQAKGVVDLNND